MKTKSLLLALTLVIGATIVSSGKDEPKRTGIAVVPVKGSAIYKLVYKGETPGRVKLNIYNDENKMIMSESFRGVNGFICPLNFEGLKDGEYTIELIDATGRKIEKISLQNKKEKKHVHISKLNEGNRFLLSVVSEDDQQDDVTVKIFDAENNLIHSQVATVAGAFAQVYKIDSSTGYLFEISDKTGRLKTVRF